MCVLAVVSIGHQEFNDSCPPPLPKTGLTCEATLKELN